MEGGFATVYHILGVYVQGAEEFDPTLWTPEEPVTGQWTPEDPIVGVGAE